MNCSVRIILTHSEEVLSLTEATTLLPKVLKKKPQSFIDKVFISAQFPINSVKVVMFKENNKIILDESRTYQVSFCDVSALVLQHQSLFLS